MAGGSTQPPVWLEGEHVRLRPVEPPDLPTVLAILDEPEVARWWRRSEWERVDELGTTTFVIELRDGADAGTVGGCVQFTEETDPDYFSAAVDIFVATAAQDRGVGPDAVRTLIDWLSHARGHHRVTVDPAAENARAIHVYEKLGFRRVGVLQEYERAEDGRWRDGLLMELLTRELR